MLKVEINNREVSMELDTGAPCAIMSYNTLKKNNIDFSLQKSDRLFSSYTGHRVNCMGYALVSVKYGKVTRRLKFIVVKDDFDSLFGREWISQFITEINFNHIFSSSEQVKNIKCRSQDLSPSQKSHLDKLMTRFQSTFSETAGKIKGPPAKVHFKPGATPVFTRAREVPIALREAYARAID